MEKYYIKIKWVRLKCTSEEKMKVMVGMRWSESERTWVELGECECDFNV
jgi:hypothetical protein